MSTMNLGLDEVQCTERRTSTRKFAIRGGNHYFTEGSHRPSQNMQSD
jgi:hypothetical protein